MALFESGLGAGVQRLVDAALQLGELAGGRVDVGTGLDGFGGHRTRLSGLLDRPMTW
jgi:hypothetical protein